MDLTDDSNEILNKMQCEDNPSMADSIIEFLFETDPQFDDLARNTDRVQALIHILEQECERYELPERWFDVQFKIITAYKSYFGNFTNIFMADDDDLIMEFCVKLEQMYNDLVEQYAKAYWFDLGLYLEFNKYIMVILDRTAKIERDEDDLCLMMKGTCSLGGESN
jgi:hypothetical protein